MPGKLRLTANDIRGYLASHPSADDNEMARHFGVKAELVNVIRKKAGIELRSNEGGIRVGGLDDPAGRPWAASSRPPTGRWKEPIPRLPPPSEDLARELIEDFRRLEPELDDDLASQGPFGLYSFFKDRSAAWATEADRLRGESAQACREKQSWMAETKRTQAALQDCLQRVAALEAQLKLEREHTLKTEAEARKLSALLQREESATAELRERQRRQLEQTYTPGVVGLIGQIRTHRIRSTVTSKQFPTDGDYVAALYRVQLRYGDRIAEFEAHLGEMEEISAESRAAMKQLYDFWRWRLVYIQLMKRLQDDFAVLARKYHGRMTVQGSWYQDTMWSLLGLRDPGSPMSNQELREVIDSLEPSRRLEAMVGPAKTLADRIANLEQRASRATLSAHD